MPLHRTTTWSGSLRVTPFVITTILLTSTTAFGLAVASAKQTYAAPIDTSLWSYTQDHRWSVIWHIFYFTTAPFLTLLHSLLDLTLYLINWLSPVYVVLSSLVLIIAWIMQLVYWFQCDLAASSDQCEQFFLVHGDRNSMADAIVGVETGVTYARIAVGFVVVAL